MSSWWLIYQAKVSRLDEAIKSQLIRVGRPRMRFWQFDKVLLPQIFGTDAETLIALLVSDSHGNTLYQSDNWPSDLKVNNLVRSHSQPLPSVSRSSSLEQERLERPRFRDFPPPNKLPAPRFKTQHTSTETWRVGTATFPYIQAAMPTTVRIATIAVSLNSIEREMLAIRNIFLISIFLVLFLITGGAWWLSGNALRPIRRLTRAIEQVTVKGLDQRVPIGTTDVEFVELIQVFNQMLESLERSFKQASRFSGDAAHELKTPLAILQGELEWTLQKAEVGSEVQQSLSSLLDEVRRLSGIVRKLLLLSLADAGRMSLYQVEVNLSEILAQMEEDLELLAPHLEVQIEIAAQLRVQGDRDLLTQVLQNLISNAIKYNLADGWIKIHARQQQATVLVTITNSSKTIPPSDRERIFERFHRGDPARTRKVEGTGLGLSLSREIARAHYGDLTLDSTPSDQTAFTLTLPLEVKHRG
jgi:heavy metal sensor kinase